MTKKKEEIEVRYIIDTREKDLNFIKKLKFDTSFDKDKIKIIGYEIKTCIPKGIKTSTGDITIEFRKKGDKKWNKTSLSIELKKNSDIFSTLYSNMRRFKNELKRAKDNELDFYILHNWNFEDVKNHINMLQYKKKLGYKSQPFFTFLNNYLLISKDFPIISVGNNFEEVIRRIVKKHIKDKKLNYFNGR